MDNPPRNLSAHTFHFASLHQQRNQVKTKHTSFEGISILMSALNDMRFRSVLSHAMAVVMIVAMAALRSDSVVTAASCPAVPKSALSFACNGACAEYQPCMAGATSSSQCRCFPYKDTQIWIPIPFDNITSAELVANPPQAFETLNDTGGAGSFQWVSNEELTKIAAWNVSSSMTIVYVRS